jgi:hypothetical protein
MHSESIDKNITALKSFISYLTSAWDSQAHHVHQEHAAATGASEIYILKISKGLEKSCLLKRFESAKECCQSCQSRPQ